MDVLDRLHVWSVAMQGRDGLVVDFVGFFENIIQNFEELKTGNGRYMTSLVSNARLGPENRSKRCRTVEMYLRARIVGYDEIELIT